MVAGAVHSVHDVVADVLLSSQCQHDQRTGGRSRITGHAGREDTTQRLGEVRVRMVSIVVHHIGADAKVHLS
eukprot:CAMPEP_0180547730 /NCGR_PEP_ID=MMETSP1036_2-20121128/71244_1 /TAXON_ID=632150 /ORGANISM="Azadinium spinosum, Strain 3D9" /LENGTH=71 /DNA_ID=CAMNT_0022562889 /DNA_START=234 /DNA_END=449 /DNA_ORIENTATION=-